MRFYGRTEEIATLRHFWSVVQNRKTAQMVSVFGRRCVGKTTLIRKAFENETAPVLSFMVQDRSEASTAQTWTQAVCRAFDVPYTPTFTKAADVIAFAMSLAKTKPAVFIIDECQAFNRWAPAFWSELQGVWDRLRDDSPLLLVMSGSIVYAMEDIFGNASKPLFGRTSGQIEVRAFTPSVIRQIVTDENPAAAPMDLLTVYAITGGVAEYLRLLVENDALTQKAAVRFLFSGPGAWLRSEGAIYLANEYRSHAPDYNEILHAVAAGATQWSQIEERVGSDIRSYMTKLEQFRILERVRPIFAESTARKARYRIADPYLKFWLTFVDPIELRDLANNDRWDELVARCESGLPTYLGRTLERWFQAKLLEDGPWSPVASWWDRKSDNDIDIVAVNESKKELLLGEVKTNPKKYSRNLLSLRSAQFLKANPKFSDWTLTLRGFFPEDM